MTKKFFFTCLLLMLAGGAIAQTDTTLGRVLEEVSVSGQKAEGLSRMSGALNGLEIGQDELFRAACCNLGESFVTNPSVDVNYNDAATGARQIKLLGLEGQYVQMLIENMPVTAGAAMPYTLGYVPGSWMKSISLSKGAASVKNGPQSITGQINIEYLKPDDEESLHLNFYTDSRLKIEANAIGNKHLGNYLSSVVLAHYEQDFMHMDEDDNGWKDSPNVRQLHVQNRWEYHRKRYIMHAGVGYLTEKREGGQMSHNAANPYKILIDAHRIEAYMKHALLIAPTHNTNLALIATGSLYTLDGTFGIKDYADRQREMDAQIVLEHDFNEDHSLSTGLSLGADRIAEQMNATGIDHIQTEYTPGMYAQYTYKPSYKLTAMAGLRADYSSLFGRTYLTPRIHLKWMPSDWLTLRGSVGKGYRTPMPLADNHYLLASGRSIVIGDMRQEEAWNSGLCMVLYIPLKERTLTVNAEYYYTHFINQAVVDYDSDPTAITIDNLDGRSFSHTLQVDADYDFTDELNLMAAFRYNRVLCTYGGTLMEKPLQSRYKGLLTLGWKPMMALWQVDITLQLNGGGRIPAYLDEQGILHSDETFSPYPQLNLQVTREFRRFSVYVGGENLTNYRQPNPVINAANPWSATFDPTLVWGPVHGIMAYAGIRMNM